MSLLGQIDDRQTLMPKRNAGIAIGPVAGIVRAAMADAFAHVPQICATRRFLKRPASQGICDSAHCRAPLNVEAYAST